MNMQQSISQGAYAKYLAETTEFNKEFVKSLPAAEQEMLRKLKDGGDASVTKSTRETAVKNLLRAQVARIHGGEGENAFGKAGVNSTLGFNFYDLRGPTQLSFPVNCPFRNELARIGRVNDGYGTAAHWMATRNLGSNYAGVLEGQRGQTATPDNNQYTATYKEVGVERAATFTSEFAGEGFTDNVADEHLRGMYQLWLQEEGLMLLGNSGTASGNNGFALGTAPTPTLALKAGNGLTTGTTVYVACVAITAMGFPNNNQYGYGVAPTVAAGLVPSYSRTNADGTTTTVNGGTSAISALSASILTTAGNNQVVASVAPVTGAVAYAWYVNITGATLAGALLAGITTVSSFTITAAPAGTQSGTAAGLSSDHSFQNSDFDGLISYAASTPGAYWKDVQGATLTSGKDGTVNEIETVLQDRWNNYQTGIDAIWCGTQARMCLDQAIRYSGTASPAYRFEYSRDAQNNLLGGYVVSAYQSKWSLNANGGDAIPIKTHPMLPSGMIFFDVKNNPYPHSRAPFVRGMLVQREYYSIEWPLVSRQWQFGTYVHEVLAHMFPWISGVINGVGPFVGN